MVVRIVNGDMWQGLYINNELVCENHHIEFLELINAMKRYNGTEIISEIDFTEEFADIDWLDDVGGFPENYSDVKLS